MSDNIIHKCWKCGKLIKHFNIHHIDGNHTNDNFNNKVYLCRNCHNLIQEICDKCKKQPNCRVGFFKLCWESGDLPPQHFEIKQSGKTASCKQSIYIIDKILHFACVLGKIKGKHKYPCYYSAKEYGCGKGNISQKLQNLMENEEYRNILKSFKELKGIFEAVKPND